MDWLAKLFGNIGNSVGGAASNIGRGVGSAMQGMGNAISPMLSSAAPFLGNMAKNITQQAPNVMSGFNGQNKQPGASQPTGQTGGGLFGGIMPAIQGLMGGGQGSQKQTGQSSGSQTSPMQSQNIQSMLGTVGNLFPTQPPQQSQPQQTQVQTPTAPSQPAQSSGPLGWLSGLFSPQQGQPNMGQALVGGGLGLAGQLMPTPKQPDLSQLSSVNAFKNFDINKNTQEIRPELLKAFQDQTALRDQQEQKALYAGYANLQPGNSPEESSTFKTDLTNLNRTQADRASAELAQLYAQNAATQMGLNKQEAQQMQQVAQLDVDQIMNQFGIDYANAMKLKEMFGNMGGEMVSSAFGAFNPVGGE